MTSKRAAIIYNPASGRSGRRAEKVRDLIRLLAERGITAQGHATQTPHDATRLARQALSDGAEIIVSYGGDGTLNEVIQAMANDSAALAVWPGGTANVAAMVLGMPTNRSRLADVIAAGKTKRIALGIASKRLPVIGSPSSVETAASNEAENLERMATEHVAEIAPSPLHPLIPSSLPSVSPAYPSRETERYFFLFAGIGLDASIARKVNVRLKRVIGELAYWIEGIKHLFSWQPQAFVVEVDGQRYDSVFTLIANGNGYGGRLYVTPNARLEDPIFELHILPPQRSKLVYLRDLINCMLGKPEKTSGTLVRGLRVTANSSHLPWVEVDGEVIGSLPMQFAVAPDALTVIVP